MVFWGTACFMNNTHINMKKHFIHIHPGRLTWNIQITHLERKMIFQTSMIMFHVNLQGCISSSPAASPSIMLGTRNIGEIMRCGPHKAKDNTPC